VIHELISRSLFEKFYCGKETNAERLAVREILYVFFGVAAYSILSYGNRQMYESP